MRTSTAPTPTNYADAAKILDAGRTSERKIANNTYLHRVHGGMIAVRLHDTDIVTWDVNGPITFYTGGWNTSTTRERLNRYAPPGVGFYQRDGVAYVRSHGNVKPLDDGITLDAAGHVLADR